MKYRIFNKFTEFLGKVVTPNSEEDSDGWRVVSTIGPFTKDGLVMIIAFTIVMAFLYFLRFIY